MKNFARIENGIVIERLDAKELPPFHPSLYWVECPAECKEGWLFDEGEFTLQPLPLPSVASQILAIEAQITPRRMREAILTTEGAAWLSAKEAEIEALRAQA